MDVVQLDQDRMECNENQSSGLARSPPVENAKYGDWMLVKKPCRRRVLKGEKAQPAVEKVAGDA